MRHGFPMIRCLARSSFWLATSVACLLGSSMAAAAPELHLVIENHKFTPTELRLPAGQRVKLMVENRDATAEEFESYELNREKVIPGKSSAVIWIGPLKPGRYAFVGEFNAASARGTLIAE